MVLSQADSLGIVSVPISISPATPVQRMYSSSQSIVKSHLTIQLWHLFPDKIVGPPHVFIFTGESCWQFVLWIIEKTILKRYVEIFFPARMPHMRFCKIDFLFISYFLPERKVLVVVN